jgi:hypothetical protein
MSCRGPVVPGTPQAATRVSPRSRAVGFSSSLRMHELALGHGQMMRLVMRPTRHDADEA